MAKKSHWISKAVRHPGRETERAKRNGISVHEQLERDSHSKDPSLRGAGNLGLRFEKGIGHKHKSAGDRMKGRYGHG